MEKKFKHADICKELNNIYIAKNADYGDSFGKSYESYGNVMAIIRLNDKLSRFEQLIKHKSEVKNESIRDTLIDLANYAIMTIIEMDLKKEEKDAELKRIEANKAEYLMASPQNRMVMDAEDFANKQKRDKAEHLACSEVFFNS